MRSTTSRWKTPPTREEKKSEAGVDLLSGGRREPRPPRLTTRQRLVPYPRCPSSIFPARTCCTVCIHASIHQFLQQPTRGAVSEKRPSSCSLTAIASLGVRGCEQAARTLLTRTLTPPPAPQAPDALFMHGFVWTYLDPLLDVREESGDRDAVVPKKSRRPFPRPALHIHRPIAASPADAQKVNPNPATRNTRQTTRAPGHPSHAYRGTSLIRKRPTP